MEDNSRMMEVYQEIKSISEELIRIDLFNKIINPVREHNSEVIEEIFESFKNDNPNLWDRFCKVKNFFDSEDDAIILVDENKFETEFSDEMLYNFSILLILSECEMRFASEEEAFENSEVIYLNNLENFIEIII